MHGSITIEKGPFLYGIILTLSLSRFKKRLSSSLEHSHLAVISWKLHLVAAWPYKPYLTGCEGPVQSMSARS